MLERVNSVLGNVPIIGCNSDGTLNVSAGIVNESAGFSRVMLLKDPKYENWFDNQ